MKTKRKLLSILMTLALVVGMIPAFGVLSEASGDKLITDFWDSNGWNLIESVHVDTSRGSWDVPQSGGISVTPGEIVTVSVSVRSGFAATRLSIDITGGSYVNLGDMNYQGSGIWSLSFKMPDWEGNNECRLYIPTKTLNDGNELEMPVGYWDGGTIKWKAVSGADSYELSMEQLLGGESSLPFRATVEVDDKGFVKDSSHALIIFGMQNKPLAGIVTFDKETGFYSFDYTKLINILREGRYNYRLQAKKTPNMESEMFATAKMVTGAQLKDGYTQMPSKVNFTNFTLPTNGGTYTSDIKTTSDFPGKVTRYVFQMFHKSMNGTTASAGDNVAFVVYVALNDGYEWADSKTAYLDGKPQEMTIHNDSMGTEYGFMWTFTIGYTDKIQITDQSPGTVEYVNGEDVKLFVNATGADSYQWQKYTVRSGGGKQQIRPDDIEGATGSTYTISKADSSAAGTYRCALSCSDGTIYTKDIVLKMVDEKTTNPFVDVYESDEYYDAVLWAYYADPQITNGMDETHFGPDLTVTRAQAVTFLWRSQGCPEPTSLNNPFVDVPTGEWYYKPVLWAVENDITRGTTDTTFAPDDTLTTQHMITFLYRTKNPGMDGWDGEAAAWAADSNGKPFGVDIEVNNTTPCPRCNVVQFLYKLSK